MGVCQSANVNNNVLQPTKVPIESVKSVRPIKETAEPVRPSTNNDEFRVLCFNSKRINTDELLGVTNAVTVFDDLSAMESSIRENDCDKIVIVFTETPDENLVHQFETVSKVKSIYTLKSTKKGTKNNFATMTNLCQQLKIDLKGPEKSSIEFDLVQQLTSSSKNKQNKQEATFMYTQLFNEMILKTTENDLKTLWDFCRKRNKNDQDALKFLDKLEEEYRADRAIYWYTYDSFFYRMLNRALREHRYDIIYQCRVFIRHLHEQISFEYEKTKNTEIQVYRGMIIDEKQLENFKTKVGGLMSMSSFLSTSRNRQVAETFAFLNREKGEGLISLLMEITVDKNSSSPIANIIQLSEFPKEEEYLFSIGAVFRLQSLDPLPEDGWILRLHTTSDSDEILTNLKQFYHGQFKDKNLSVNIGRLLYELEKYEDAREFFLQGLEKEKHWHRRAAIYNNLGSVEAKLNHPTEAIEYYQKALELTLKNGGENSADLSAAYNNIGSFYFQQNKIDLALENFLEAEKAYERSEKKKAEYIIGVYHNIGTILNRQGKYDEAVEYFNKSLAIQRDHYKIVHPNMAATCRSLADAYRFRNSFTQAVEHAEQAAEIARSTLPENHRERTGHEEYLQKLKNEMKS